MCGRRAIGWRRWIFPLPPSIRSSMPIGRRISTARRRCFKRRRAEIPCIAGVFASCQHVAMIRAIDLRVVELLAARLCHDLIGPISAISNGVELLADEEPEFARDAVALVGDSARKASGRLQFYRFAYGFSGGRLAGPAPYQLA